MNLVTLFGLDFGSISQFDTCIEVEDKHFLGWISSRTTVLHNGYEVVSGMSRVVSGENREIIWFRFRVTRQTSPRVAVGG